METEPLIVRWPNSLLKQPCLPVEPSDPSLPALVADLKSILGRSGGVGLAANQIGVLKQVLVLKAGQGIEVFLNPKIIHTEGPRVDMKEGCLSLPGWTETVRRFETITVQHLCKVGVAKVGEQEIGPYGIVNETFDGLRAHILQHEIDHLNGKFFLDYRRGAADQVRTLIRKGVLK